jgi:ribosome-binding protein aMBF1 (putative translation factor)
MLITANTSYVKMRIHGQVSDNLLRALKREYGGSFRVTPEPDDALEDWSIAGKVVRAHRESLGWTEAQLGRMLEVPASFVSDLENGRRMVSKQTAKELARIFKVSVKCYA